MSRVATIEHGAEGGDPYLVLDGVRVGLFRRDPSEGGGLVLCAFTEDADDSDQWDGTGVPRLSLMVNDSNEELGPDGHWTTDRTAELVRACRAFWAAYDDPIEGKPEELSEARRRVARVTGECTRFDSEKDHRARALIEAGGLACLAFDGGLGPSGSEELVRLAVRGAMLDMLRALEPFDWIEA